MSVRSTSVRSTHRLFGLLLCLPLLVWVASAVVFLLKPGYAGAYHIPELPAYTLTVADLESIPTDIIVNSAALQAESFVEAGESKAGLHDAAKVGQFRVVRSIIGVHYLINAQNQWQQISSSGLIRPYPDKQELTLLFADVQRQWPERYGVTGKLVDVLRYKTDTDVVLSLDWHRLTLSQRGQDTELIDQIYRMHYLQWTGLPWLDRVLGVVGLCLLLGITSLGVIMLRPRSRPKTLES